MDKIRLLQGVKLSLTGNYAVSYQEIISNIWVKLNQIRYDANSDILSNQAMQHSNLMDVHYVIRYH